jgi:hypothetical protein
MFRRTKVVSMVLPRVDPLWHPGKQQRQSTAGEFSKTVKRSRNFEKAGAGASFPVKSRLHHFDKGLDPDATRFVAEAEEQYRLSSERVYRRQPGGTGATAEKRRVLDTGENGAVEEVEVLRIAAPFGETYVPSGKEAYAFRGKVGELTAQRDDKWMAADERRDASMAFEAEVRRVLLEAGGLLQDKAEACVAIMIAARQKRLLLQPATVEMAMQVWQQADGDQEGSSPRYLGPMKDAYMYLRGTLAAPTPFMIEALMLMLARSDTPSKRDASFAHFLLLDCDRYVSVASRTTYAAYFDICNKNELMHFAVARYVDAVDRLHLEPDTGMVQALLRGLNQNGLVEEAVAFLARIKEIPLDVHLLNSIMETLLVSADPRACFSAYEASRSAPIIPNAETFTLLLLAADRLADWSSVRSVLATMQRRRIKGSPTLLNLLVKGLLHERLDGFAHQLYRTMVSKNIQVWGQLEDAMPSHVRIAAGASASGPRRPADSGVVLNRRTVSNEPSLTNDGSPEGLDNGPADLRAGGSHGQPERHGESAGRRIFTPRDVDHLRKVAAKRPRKLMRVSLPYLAEFIRERGVVLSPEQATNRLFLVRKVFKLLFGSRGPHLHPK